MKPENILSGPPEVEIEKPDDSFGQYVLNTLREKGNTIVEIHGITGVVTTAADLLTLSVRIAEILRAKGITKYDKISISSENRVEFTAVALAALYLGAALAPLNVTYTEYELKHALSLSKPSVIFCSPLTVQKIHEVTRQIPFVKQVTVFGDTSLTVGVPTLDSWLSDVSVPRGDINKFVATAVDVETHTAAILCSSGTTGLPKGVELTHFNMTVCIGHMKLTKKRVNIEKPIVLALLPWFHAYGLVSHIAMLCNGYLQIVIPKFEEQLFLKCIQDYKITNLMLVPPLMVFLAKHPAVEKYNLSSVREIGCGAAPLGKEIIDAVRKRVKSVEAVFQGYGLTETTLAVLMTPIEGAAEGSTGTLAPGTLGKVVDLTTGEPLGPYQQGELCFKGSLMMKGYVGDRNSTDAIFDEGNWLHTGDIGYYDKNGHWFVVDRLKELIKYKGFQVPPAELEAVLLTHTGVKDAAVIGIPDEAAGELPLAFIVRQPGSNVTETEIKDFVASKMSPAKRLHGGVKIIDAIPKTASGKILRRDLRELAKTFKSKL